MRTYGVGGTTYVWDGRLVSTVRIYVWTGEFTYMGWEVDRYGVDW